MTTTSDFPFTSPFATDAFRVKVGLAEMLKGGVIMDVVDCLLYTSPSPRD